MASFAMPQGVTVEQMLVAMSQQDIELELEPEPETVKSSRKRQPAAESES